MAKTGDSYQQWMKGRPKVLVNDRGPEGPRHNGTRARASIDGTHAKSRAGPMAWTRTEAPGETLVRIEGALDANTAPDLRSLIEALVEERRPRIVLDLGGVRLIDSSGVSAIVSLLKRAADYGGTLSVIHLAGQPREIFRLLRLDRVFDRDPARGEPEGHGGQRAAG